MLNFWQQKKAKIYYIKQIYYIIYYINKALYSFCKMPISILMQGINTTCHSSAATRIFTEDAQNSRMSIIILFRCNTTSFFYNQLVISSWNLNLLNYNSRHIYRGNQRMLPLISKDIAEVYRITPKMIILLLTWENSKQTG